MGPALSSRLYDCVLTLVIEHIDGDRYATRELGGLLKPGGQAVFRVPTLYKFAAVPASMESSVCLRTRGVFSRF